MEKIKDFDDFNPESLKIKEVLNQKNITMKDILSLIFYAANKYEVNDAYDHAAMAYLKAFTLWLVIIDMLNIDQLIPYNKYKIKRIVEKMTKENSWFRTAADKTSSAIMLSNGQSQRQWREKFNLRDIAYVHNKEATFDMDKVWNTRVGYLYDPKEREEINDDITFWQSSFLGQQLIAIQNWAYTSCRNILQVQPPSPIKNYRLPVYTTRSLVLSSWINGRERLEQAELMYKYAKKVKENASSFTQPIVGYHYAKNIHNHLIDLHNEYGLENVFPGAEISYYIVSAKAIYDFNSALHYSRVITDNNQDIITPPTAFIMLNLWRLLYKLVEYEKAKLEKTNYQQARILVRNKLTDYVSDETPTSHLSLDYLANETIRQMRALINLANPSSISRLNILQNKYFLDDDYEDPGFHLDWTVGQMMIPSALEAIKQIEADMETIQH